MKKIVYLILSILISLGVGALAGKLTMNSMGLYEELILPKISPPGSVFPVVWTVLYILMGISAYLIYISNSPYKKKALTIYAIQLILNFLWSIIFFNMQMYLLAFIVLLLLLLAIFMLIVISYKINPIAAYLLIPYFLWVAFAGYLNISIYLLNR